MNTISTQVNVGDIITVQIGFEDSKSYVPAAQVLVTGQLDFLGETTYTGVARKQNDEKIWVIGIKPIQSPIPGRFISTCGLTEEGFKADLDLSANDHYATLHLFENVFAQVQPHSVVTK